MAILQYSIRYIRIINGIFRLQCNGLVAIVHRLIVRDRGQQVIMQAMNRSTDRPDFESAVRPPKTLPKGDAPPNVQVGFLFEYMYLEIDLGGFVLKSAWALGFAGDSMLVQIISLHFFA